MKQPKVFVASDNPTFIRKKHELTDLQKLLAKNSALAVQVLIDTMNKEDQTDKEKRECAKLLIQYDIEVSKAINQDNMARMIAEIKMNGNNSKSLHVEDDNTPLVSFDEVQAV